MNLTPLAAWLRQPTSVAGIAAILGIADALLTHQVNTAQALPMLVAALASIALPDHTAAQQDVLGMLATVLRLSKGDAAAIPAIFQNSEKLAADLGHSDPAAK